jgi:hypothetical protein
MKGDTAVPFRPGRRVRDLDRHAFDRGQGPPARTPAERRGREVVDEEGTLG